MSVHRRIHQSLLDARDRLGLTRTTTVRVLFGDRTGTVLFVVTVALGMVLWSEAVFISDNYTLFNSLAALSEGHLAIEQAPYGALNSPGMHIVDGQLYGRNYGQVVTALPLLWVLEAVATVADLRIALAGAWSLLILAGAVVIGRIAGNESVGTVAGSLLALGTFGLNVVTATPLAGGRLPILALQLQTILAAGFLAVLLYRLVSRMYDQRVGLFAGAGGVLGTPVLFWASVPKRHVVMAALTAAAMYCLYRSREGSGGQTATLFRAGAYAAVGLSTWIHAPEALALFLVLVAVDLPTGRRDPRSLVTVAVVFGVSLLPFLVTNTLIAGNPLQPPRLLPSYTGGDVGSNTADGTGDPGLGIVGTVLGIFSSLTVDGVVAILNTPGRIVPTFLRSGYLASVAERGSNEAINLALLESAPVLAGMAALPVVVARRAMEGGFPAITAERVIDWFAIGTSLLYILLYIPRLPLHAQLTVRYLLVLFPLGVYGIVRLPVVRATVREAGTLLAFVFAGSTLIGGQLLVGYIILADLTFGEALQLTALVGLAAAVGLAGWTVAATYDGRRNWPRVGAVVLGSALASATVLSLLVGLYYLDYGHLLPAVQRLLNAVPTTGM